MARSITFLDYFQNEPRRLTLRAGETVQDHFRETTDEGWRSTSTTWTFDGARLLRVTDSDGVDCDGRMSRHNEQTTTVADARAGYQDNEGDRWPLWRDVPRAGRQRDYSAERMGY